MGRYLYLMKNIGLLTLSNFATKLISFFLVPLYTNILTTTQYGTYDLFNTSIGLLIPIVTLNIQEAVIRFPMDNKYDRKSVISIGMKYFFIGTGIVSIGLVINYICSFSEIIKHYTVFFLLMYISQSLIGIILGYVRGIDKITILSISSVLSSVVTIGCNILFLLVFKWGLIGYFLANIVGPIFQAFYIIIRANIYKEIKIIKCISSEEQEMVSYSKPMIANSVAWWVNNTSDRYIVIFFCGLAQNGIYSVASKIPSILNIVQLIFSQAWTLSVVKDFDKDDKDGFFANTYKVYNCIMVVCCSAIIMGDKILARFLYAKEFYAAWKYVPWLTIAIVFGALSGYIGGFFSAVKKSKIFAQSTIVGAIINIILNIILTQIMGALGAAIATTVCYFVTWIFRYIHSRKIVRLQINLCRDIISYILLIIQSCALLMLNDKNIVFCMELVIFSVIVLLYSKNILWIFKKGIKTVRNRQKY